MPAKCARLVQRAYEWNPWKVLLYVCCICSAQGSFAPNPHSMSLKESEMTDLLPGIKPDPFVQAAPLIVAAVCKDGIVVLAAHSSDEDEPLLYGETTSSDTEFQDLPEGYKGPFRINALDTSGTVLVCAGWRADCEALVARGRGLAQAERRLFGPSASPLATGTILSKDLSLYLAQCACSERVRSLSCAALLMVPSRTQGGHIWLIDATGAYPVSALSLAGGWTGDKTQPAASSLLNTWLAESSMANMDTQEAFEELLKVLTGEVQEDSEMKPRTRILRKGSRVEAAIIVGPSGKVSRKTCSGVDIGLS